MFGKKVKLRVHTIGGWNDGEWIDNSLSTGDFDKADIIIIPGGVDVYPGLYGEKVGRNTQAHILGERDKREKDAYERAVAKGKYIIGICRGMQLMTVLNGGKLVQHMRHYGDHPCQTYDGQICVTNSLHHQLAYPWNIPQEQWKLLMWTVGISNTFLNGDDKEIEFPLEAFTNDGYIIEPEGIYFHKTRSLGVQWHPEMMGFNKGWDWNLLGGNTDIHTLEYLNKIIDKTFNNTNYFLEEEKQLIEKQ